MQNLKEIFKNRLPPNFFVVAIMIICFYVVYKRMEHPTKMKNANTISMNVNDWIIERDSVQKWIMNNSEIRECSCLFSEKQDSLNTKSLIANQFCVLLFIPENTCGYCLDAEMGNIGSLHDRFPKESFKIITKFIYKKEIRNFKVFNNITSFDVLSSGNSDIGIKSSNIQKPFYIIVNNELHITEIFIPNPNMQELTIKFLISVLQKYFMTEA